jgi:hypothetical protein
MPLTIHAYLTGKAKVLHTMEIRNDGETIGYYERSQPQDIARKEREIYKAASMLLDIYGQHGEFIVRWDGDRAEKVVKDKNGIERGVIPRNCWERPSWQK